MKAAEKELREILELKQEGKGRKNYSIRAGAGGGKTTLLSTRISRQIAAGIPIEEFVIITYTNAAAAELREKVGERLRELAASDAVTETERANAGEAQNRIELMQISTIHSFLLKILREFAFESGIVLDAKMLEDEEDSARREDFFNKWYDEKFDEIRAYREDWTLTVKSTGAERDVTRDVLKNLFFATANIREEIVCDASDHTDDFEKAAKDYIAEWLPKLIIFKDELLANRPCKKDGTPKPLNRDPQNIADSITDVQGAAAKGIEEAIQLSGAVGAIRKILQKNASFYGAAGDNLPLEGVIPEIPEWELAWDFDTLYHTYMLGSQKAARAAAYVKQMRETYREETDKKTLEISNDDILFRAEKLLTTHPEVLDRLRKKYSKIYVDEFQDTTGLQAGLVMMLCEKPGTKPGSGKLEADKLIVVGDPKQSIYRFTGAEIAVYDRTDAMLAAMPEEEAESVFLDTNFRSEREIVDWVNGRFSKLMPSAYSPMETDRTIREKNALHGVFRFAADLGTDAKGNPLKYKREDDVDAVAELVKRLVNDPHCFIEEPGRAEEGTAAEPSLRRIRYSDIMIISKVTTNIKSYVERFAAEGIPVNVQGKFRISEDPVLRSFVLLTEYLAAPKNRKKRITAAQIVSGLDVLKTDAEGRKEAEDSLRELRAYFREHAMDTAAVMRYLLSREELFLPKGVRQPPERVREYRIRLYQMVETCLTENDGDLFSFSERMNEYIEKEIRREIPLESNENAVRLMNVHQAKGLTGQIVILADRSQKEKCRYSGFKKNGKYYPAVNYGLSAGAESGTVTIPAYGWDVGMLRQAYTEESEEAVRLQYVAATRAAHALIIMPVIYGQGLPNAWFTDERYRYDTLPEINDWLAARAADPASYPLCEERGAHSLGKIDLKRLEENKAAADFSELGRKRMVSITPSGLEPAGVTGYMPGDPGFVKEERPGANVFGTVMHRVYELLFRNYASLKVLPQEEREAQITRSIDRAILESVEDMRAEDKPEEFHSYLKAKMTEGFASVITPVMEEAEEVYPEYSFSFFVEPSGRDVFLKSFGKYLAAAKTPVLIEGEDIWVNGQADLVVKRKDGSIRVYDYKSDAPNGKPLEVFEADLEKKYAGQMALYRYAIGKAFGVDGVTTELIHLYRGGEKSCG